MVPNIYHPNCHSFQNDVPCEISEKFDTSVEFSVKCIWATIFPYCYRYNFVVVAEGFIIHMPHAPSFELTRYRSSSHYRRFVRCLSKYFCVANACLCLILLYSILKVCRLKEPLIFLLSKILHNHQSDISPL